MPSDYLAQDEPVSTSANRDADAEEARTKQALLERPRFSVKARLTVIFLVFFLVSAGISVASVLMLSLIDDRVQFVSLADRFANEIQSARRGEKNYFLYGTDLGEVRQHVDSANAILDRAALELGHVVGRQEIEDLRTYLGEYESLVAALLARGQDEGYLQSEEYARSSQSLRDYGSRMLELSLDVSRQERIVITETIERAVRVQIALLVVLLVFSVFAASYITRHITSRLQRLMTATQQFAAGNFLPLKPIRKYKDEYSQLAIALNHMMFELERRQNILLESHKLRAVGDLTAGVAHELNNPINNIILTSEIMKETYKELDDEERQDMINDLVTQSQRAQQVVRNLLDFARESETKTEDLHIDRLLNETIDLAKNQIRLAKIEFRQDIPENLPPVYGDRKLLIQVFLNLLLNAIDAMPNGGTLTVRVTPEKKTSFVAIHIVDTGIGIPKHTLGSIFNPFFTTKPTGKGTGLGLSVAKGIIEKHGGDISVVSTVGEGTTFTVELPSVPIPGI
jgi:signal transduction histidine kinase